MNEDVLRRVAAAARAPRLPCPVSQRDVALLGAELGRPLPGALLRLWHVHGAGFLGSVYLWEPGEIAQGVGIAERWLDQGLLPFAHGGDGALWLLEMYAGDDPGVVASSPPERTPLGSLSSTVELAAIAALGEADTAAPEGSGPDDPQKPRPKRSM